MRLADKVIVLAGAGGGLGSALTQRLVDEGARLVLGDVDGGAMTELAAGLDADQVATKTTNVAEPDDVHALVAAAVDRFGRIDVMINNAGVLSPNARVHNVTEADWSRVLSINLMGAVHGVAAAAAVMRASGGGAIINTGSIAGLTAWSHAAPYAVSKAAVVHLTKVAALEYAREGVRVNCVCPGTFRSRIHETLPESAMDSMAARHPLGLGSADDVVGAYVYLASDDARWVTGSALVVDGGYSAP